MNIGGRGVMAQNLKQKTLKKAFSPKMLVYENLKNENVLKHFKNRFAQLDTLLNHPIWVKSPVINLGLNSQHTADIRNTDSLYWSKTAHEQLAIARHNGLEVTGQVYARPDAYFDADNDNEDQVSKYKAKTQAELGWNIINSKFYQGKEKKAKVALANELSRLQSKKRMTADIYEKAAEELTEQYNFYIGTIIAHRLDNLDIMNEAYQYMLEKDRISNDKMLKVMNEKLAAEYDISILCSNRDISNKPIYRMKPTRILVDTTALWHHIDEESIDARIVMVKEQIADNDSKLANYLSTTRITPFARWSSYWQSNNKISNNGDIGVRFTIPIYNENPRKRKALETEKEIIRSSRSTDVKEIKQSVGILLKRIENLNQAIATEAFHIEQTGKYIDMRRFAYKNQKQGYNYLMRMDEYTGFLESMERMYKLMLNRGLAIINIEKAVSIYDNNTIFREIEL
ncbi:MAG: hypothetical protein EGR07_08270 [Prevotella sp.]|nr:hypothetical protein [Prevotella sp.]